MKSLWIIVGIALSLTACGGANSSGQQSAQSNASQCTEKTWALTQTQQCEAMDPAYCPAYFRVDQDGHFTLNSAAGGPAQQGALDPSETQLLQADAVQTCQDLHLTTTSNDPSHPQPCFFGPPRPGTHIDLEGFDLSTVRVYDSYPGSALNGSQHSMKLRNDLSSLVKKYFGTSR